MTYAIHGTTDEVTVCSCCGKKNLRNTVILEVLDGDYAGDVLHFGSHCAARALGQSKSKAELIVIQAKRRAKVQPIIDFIKSNIHRGVETIKDEAKALAKQNLIDVTVSGFDSWGLMNVDYPGGRVTITAQPNVQKRTIAVFE